MLETREVSKRFGGIKALAGVTLSLHPGELLGLIGPNGAGKSTFFNVVAGVYRADSGTVRFRDRDIGSLPPHARCQLGLARTFQLTKPFFSLSVLENVTLGAYYGRKGDGVTLADARAAADEVLHVVGLSAKRDHLASTLTAGERKRLELARALATKPSVLLLDEVIAGLSSGEVGSMMEIIRSLPSTGVGILMVEHVMRAVMAISDRIVVFHQGRVLATDTPAAIANDPEVVSAYLGSSGSAAARSASA
ncbi:MAG: ABC transporter ATP-binding protein [Gemmatimonadetes bacterium]|nr:ABC transporter ATP-binding protein [Gemmatimonadota bacterium]